VHLSGNAARRTMSGHLARIGSGGFSIGHCWPAQLFGLHAAMASDAQRCTIFHWAIADPEMLVSDNYLGRRDDCHLICF